MKRKLLIFFGILIAVGIIMAVLMFVSNPYNYKTIGNIRPPLGYERAEAADNAYANYFRSLPLRKRGTLVHLHTGGLARLQWLSAAVVDMPTLSNDEQCADVCMRLRAEYLFEQKRYSEIRFVTVGGKTLTYQGGSSRQAFEKFMRNVYGSCNTASLYKQLKQRPLKDMQVGDVFVYPARKGHKYGHAVMVADVVQNRRTGKKAFLLVEGNTPARDIHVVRNLNVFHNPWFYLDEDAEVLQLNVFRFNANELRHY